MKLKDKKVWNLAAVVAGVFIVIVLIAVSQKRAWERQFANLDGGFYKEPVASFGVKYLVPRQDIVDSGRTEAAAPTLSKPAFEASSAGGFYADDLRGIALVLNGQERFYPFQILNWHELVDDQVGASRVLVAHSTFCGSSAVFDASKMPANFKLTNSGKVYNSCTLFEDESGNLWSAVTGTQVVGKAVGTKLPLVQSEVTTFAEWKARHANGSVLSENTGFERLYQRHPFGSYDTSEALYFPINHSHCAVNEVSKKTICDPSRKALVNVFDEGSAVTGFVKDYVRSATVLMSNGDKPSAVAMFDVKHDRVRVYGAKLGDRSLTFAFKNGKIIDNETKSEWAVDGTATKGALAGKSLVTLPTTEMFTFAFAATYPEAAWPGKPVTATDVKVEGTTIEAPATIK